MPALYFAVLLPRWRSNSTIPFLLEMFILLAVIKYKKLSIRNVKVTPGFGDKGEKGAAASPPEQNPGARHWKEGCLPWSASSALPKSPLWYVSGGLVPTALGTAFHQVTYRPGSCCLVWASPSFLFISHWAFFFPILYAWKAFQQQYFFQEKPQGPRSVAFKMSEGWIFSLLEMASVGWKKPSDEWTLRGSKLQLR